MLVIYALLFLGLLEKETISRTINPMLQTVVPVEENLIPEAFFVALAKSVVQTESKKHTSASTAINPGISHGTVPKEVPLQPLLVHQSSSRINTQERHSNSTETDEVEYLFEFGNNYEKKSGKNLVNVKGNLKKHSSYWKNVLHANDFIMNVIDFGYRIPFFSDPPSVFLKNNRSALQHSEFVENSIQELLSKNCITEVKCTFVVNPLTVSVNSSGKERLVLDL